ncbi:MAG: RedB protein [Proteobacteria bacterium]|nr:RedB protein [Pseudomonadota bacterium]
MAQGAPSPRTVLLATTAWFLAATGGMASLWTLEYAPAPAGSPPESWPAAAGVERDAAKATLVMLAHPKCPCTRASMAELERLMARNQGRISARVLFYHPKGGDESWRGGASRRTASAIPGVRVLDDEDGRTAKLFGAHASGHTLLYGRDGRLLFSGGITASRGQEGDSVGADAIHALASGRASASSSSVFGCSISASPTVASARVAN